MTICRSLLSKSPIPDHPPAEHGAGLERANPAAVMTAPHALFRVHAETGDLGFLAMRRALRAGRLDFNASTATEVNAVVGKGFHSGNLSRRDLGEISSSHRLWLSHVKGIGIYCPLSFRQLGVCLAWSILASMIPSSTSSGLWVCHQRSHAPFPSLRGYTFQKMLSPERWPLF